MPHEGEVIGGRYDLIAHLGDGGTAGVWKAHDRTLQREVAIKFLYVVDERAVEDMRKQFLREARIACAVKHRNVIQTMDFGQTEDARAYMVMELLHGEEISDRIGRPPSLTLAEIVQIIAGVLRGLQAIHDAGIVHRDLKPENVYLESDDEGVYPKILDFGIARSVDRRSTRRSVLTTKEGLIVGTPEYMSPEQARGQRDLDGRSDVWSVGVILFELLTGVLPFDDPSEADIIIKVVTTDAPRLTDIKPDASEALEAVVAKALSRDRDQRFQSAAEMLQALLEAERALGAAGTARSGRRKRNALWLGLAGALALVALIAFPSRPRVRSAGEAKRAALSTVTVELRGVPASAAVLVNGKPTAGTRLVLPDDGYSRLIEVQGPGLQPWRVMHPAGNNARYEVRMPALPEPAAAPNDVATGTGPAPETTPAPESTGAGVEKSTAATPARRRDEAVPGRVPEAQQSQPQAQQPQAPKADTETDTKPPALWRSLDF